MGYTTRRDVDESHPLSKFFARLKYERLLVRRILDRDADALRLLSEPALWPMYWHGCELDECRKRERAVERETGVFKHERCPRGWIRHDERRHLFFRLLSDTAYVPPGRTDWILQWLRGPDGGESILSRSYSQALYGSPEALGSLIMRAKESHDAFLEAARLAADTGHKETHGAHREAEKTALALLNHLPLAKDEPTEPSPTPPLEQETRAKPGPKTEVEDEKRRYRVALAWRDYNAQWEKWKAKRGLKGKARKDVEFYDWCEADGRDIPKVKKGESLAVGGKWHSGIDADIHTVNVHLERKGLKTLEEYGEDLRRRGVL